jgi:cephalosporin hydroxylase
MIVYDKILSMVKGRIDNRKNRYQLSKYGAYQSQYDQDLSLTQAVASYPDRNALYAYMHHHYRHLCPSYIGEHRSYYSLEQRGFGEDAFHAMWYLLLRQFQPAKCLEIGVYRGQVISLWSLIAKNLGFPCEVHGISPFTPIGDAVSNYRVEVDYRQDVLSSFAHFGLAEPLLLEALSSDAAAIKQVSENSWDLIYVDGGHDFETALADYQLCKNNLTANGILILDDASLGTDYAPPSFSFAGHPGPSRVAREYADKEMRLLGAVGHNNVYQKI